MAATFTVHCPPPFKWNPKLIPESKIEENSFESKNDFFPTKNEEKIDKKSIKNTPKMYSFDERFPFNFPTRKMVKNHSFEDFSGKNHCFDDNLNQNLNGNEANFEGNSATVQQNRQLFPLQEDLSDWLNKTLGLTHPFQLNGDNFFPQLDNGAILCRLARHICAKARAVVSAEPKKGPAPTTRQKCFEHAIRRSFYSRDNTDNFIMFCRQLGVHQNLLFESDDLVLNQRPRSVVLCLLEVARLANTRFGLEPPGLVQLEREIAAEEAKEVENQRKSAKMPFICTDFNEWQNREENRLESEDFKRRNSTLSNTTYIQTNNEEVDFEDNNFTIDNNSAMTELDRRVKMATLQLRQNCACATNVNVENSTKTSGKCCLRVRKVGEGRYCIAGRNVFIRLLKGRHMMVRVGGGWDTLDHFLQRHDPCQVKVLNRNNNSPNESNSSTNQQNNDYYLHIKAKYRQPIQMQSRDR